MEYNDERDMLPRHLRNYFKKNYKKRLIIANWRYVKVKIKASAEKEPPAPDQKGMMEIYNQELIDFFATLERNRVAYILVGGFAVNLHGFSRRTEDVDIWIADTVENRNKLNDTFTKCSMDRQTAQLAYGLPIKTATRLTGLENLLFEDCRKTAVIAMIGTVAVPVLPIDQLIANKKALHRQVDSLDVLALEEIQKLLITQFHGKV